jgi:outer membrane protein insertion porin family/translocation and assembly module TamA
VIYPTRLPDLEGPERLLPQARLRLEFRQPSFIEARTAGVLRAEAGLAPVLLSSNRDPTLPFSAIATCARRQAWSVPCSGS